MSIPESNFQAPLLRPRLDSQTSRRQNQLIMLLGRATGRRGSSLLVRETAARELEERRADWGYSMPVVLLDILWNAAFVLVSVAMLATTTDEKPNTPIRIWICGHALECLAHAVFVFLEYKRRNCGRSRDEERGENGRNQSDEEENSGDRDDDDSPSPSSFSRRCESLNTLASFVWWIVGFFWVVAGGDILMQLAPRLYWLAVVFLAFDVFFAVFCVLVAFLIGIALCCCLPCIIAILYAVAGQDGASEADIRMLPKYKFLAPSREKTSGESGKMVPIASSSRYLSTERGLAEEDAVSLKTLLVWRVVCEFRCGGRQECCICLTAYEDGAELHSLPCNHHFHSWCISKWLKMNATCPLCKCTILKGSDVSHTLL